MAYTLAEIKLNISTKSNWAERAILALFARQTADEQADGATRVNNGAGFNGIDAPIMSSFAKQLQQPGRHLSEKQLAIAFRKLPKYAKQLAEVAK